MARAFVKIFTIIFASAVLFGLIAHPALLHYAISDTGGLVKATRGS